MILIRREGTKLQMGESIKRSNISTGHLVVKDEMPREGFGWPTHGH